MWWVRVRGHILPLAMWACSPIGAHVSSAGALLSRQAGFSMLLHGWAGGLFCRWCTGFRGTLGCSRLGWLWLLAFPRLTSRAGELAFACAPIGGFHWGAWACVGGLHLAGVCAMFVLWLAGPWGTVLVGGMGGSGTDALGLDIGRGVFALACGWVPAMCGRGGMVWQQPQVGLFKVRKILRVRERAMGAVASHSPEGEERTSII